MTDNGYDLHIVFGQRKCSYEGEYAIEALAIADEYCVSENPDYILGELEKVRNDKEFISATIAVVHLSDDAYKAIHDRLNGQTTVEATVTLTD